MNKKTLLSAALGALLAIAAAYGIQPTGPSSFPDCPPEAPEAPDAGAR